jgi:hypothetical protein
MRMFQIESGAVAAAMAWFCSWYSHMMGLANFNEILPGRLWLGNLAGAWDRDALLALGITHIVSVTQFGAATTWYPDDFTYMCIDAQDEASVSLTESFTECNNFVTQALAGPNSKVYIHCNQGRSRSVTVLAAFLMARFGWTTDDTIAFIKKQRIEANPNPGFMAQLRGYEASLEKTEALLS